MQSMQSEVQSVKHGLSTYAESLPEEAKRRYKAKIAVSDGLDPFMNECLGDPVDCNPPVDACDLVSYLVLQTSFLTSQQFKARKGLEAYNQFVSGWVKDVITWKISDKHLTVGRVSILIKSVKNISEYNVYVPICYY